MATVAATFDTEKYITDVRTPVPAWLGHAAVHTPAETIAAPTNCKEHHIWYVLLLTKRSAQ